MGFLKSLAGPLISAGGALLGGVFGKSSNDNATDANLQINAQNNELQREFAQNGIRWKVADAKAAGLHPLAALGATGASFTPSGIQISGDNSLGNGIAEAANVMGQNINRARQATQSQAEREMEQINLDLARQNLYNSRSQGNLLDAQAATAWASINGQPANPPMPSVAGSVAAPLAAVRSVSRGTSASPAGSVKAEPSISVSSTVRDPGLEAGSTPGFKQFPISPNVSVYGPSQEFTEALDGMPFGAKEIAYALRTGDMIFNGPGTKGLPALPSGYRYSWNPLKRSYSVVPEKSGFPQPKRWPSRHPRR